ncbi:MAG: hypothetical protein KDA96_11930 [Planctomycetaceae bacterium]|nr:hypothetical protein [Planctomycetaceae bacterium]
MKKSDYRRWLSERIAGQNKLLMGSLAALSALGSTAILIEMIVFWLILKLGFCGVGAISWLLAMAIVGAVLAVTWLRLPQTLPEQSHSTEVDGTEFDFTTVPAMSDVWTYAFGSMDTSLSMIDRLLAFLALPQRMLCAAAYVAKRRTEVLAIDVTPCAAVVRLLIREGIGVEIVEIARNVKTDDLPRTLRQTSMIEGVVVVTRLHLAFAAAPRLAEDLADWAKSHKADSESDD